MTQGGHDFEWLIPHDAEPAYVPLAVSRTASEKFVVDQRRLRLDRIRPRLGFGALLILSLVLLTTALLTTALVLHERAPISGQPALSPGAESAPAWLVNRPFSAGLSPDMSPQCADGGCHFTSASTVDLAAMRALVGDRFTVRGMRVTDSLGQVRGLAVYVYDNQGDELSIDAVWVPRAPPRWDGERALLTGGAPASRWVLHTSSGVWLVQTSALGCGGNRQWSTLTGLAVHRIHPARLHL